MARTRTCPLGLIGKIVESCRGVETTVAERERDTEKNRECVIKERFTVYCLQMFVRNGNSFHCIYIFGMILSRICLLSPPAHVRKKDRSG